MGSDKAIPKTETLSADSLQYNKTAKNKALGKNFVGKLNI